MVLRNATDFAIDGAGEPVSARLCNSLQEAGRFRDVMLQ